MFASNTSQVSSDATYIEDVFSTYLYTGNGSTQTITNGIDLAGKGGMVWLKTRNVVGSNYVQDTARGATQSIYTNSTAASGAANILSSFTSSGFVDNNQFSSGDTIASWTFRKQPKFFDVVTYTGDGTAGRQISHSLGSTPGCVIVKRTDTTGNWATYHRSLSANNILRLNTTDASIATSTNITAVSATTFTLGTAGAGVVSADVNASGGTYVAYLFAHDAGGFGLTGTDNVISCGSFTQPSSGDATITLGYEPQWVMIKRTDAVSNWFMYDIMRGMSQTTALELLANTAAAEGDIGGFFPPTATGFISKAGNLSAGTYIYIAIRRGPMKTPTSGASVFTPVAYTGTNANNTVTSGFVTDSVIEGARTSTTAGTKFGAWDRLRGINYLLTTTTAAEVAAATTIIQANPWDSMTGLKVGTTGALTNSTNTGTYAYWMFKRAPGFFDEVCYTGTGSARTVTHNLGVVPELIITKRRDSTSSWITYSALGGIDNWLTLNLNEAFNTSSGYWGSSPTASVFGLGATSGNLSGGTYVAYLFASCPGVSKVGSYTGNGSSQTINCGFTGGARFVMIKRTDSTGDWYVWDTARGIVSASDPRLSLNSTAAEVTTDDSIDPDNSGFIVNQVSATNINVSSATYIYLAIA